MVKKRTIFGYPNYIIYSNGKVWNIKKKRFISIHTNSIGGQCRVSLRNEMGSEFLQLSRLVAIHFIANPQNLPIVNHLDGIKSNCNDWNLEWDTHSGNLYHAWANGLNTGPCKLNLQQRTEIKREYKKLVRKGTICKTQEFLAQKYKVDRNTIKKALGYKYGQFKGYFKM